ncbi:MAG TPA: 23S rRNA (adenine(2030)-N(6))-methyltransferase RlmJ, partial [Myxococcota bacterium]|nr:23S rRNA (adenine(2030)-N(6))-methyltransferase RlmJ [Myxococcota bacterium]
MAELDYSHRFHVGNHGDVWKHVAWCAVLDALRPRAVLDTHAGEGAYTLGPTGEWTAGVGRVWAAPELAGDPCVGRYLE